MHQTTCRGPSCGNTQQEPDWTILRSKVKVKYAKNPIFKHGVPHSSFIYRPNRLKMHRTTCRGPSYGNTQQEPDWTILRSKVKVKYAKNPIFKHGVPHSSFIYRPNRLKMQNAIRNSTLKTNTNTTLTWRTSIFPLESESDSTPLVLEQNRSRLHYHSADSNTISISNTM